MSCGRIEENTTRRSGRRPDESAEPNGDELSMIDAIQASSRASAIPRSSAKHALHPVDRVQLQQVILNLIINGMDAMSTAPKAQRRLTGRTTCLNDGSAEISISDSGPGIPPDKLDHIFEPFFTTKENGMGMGLSIARTIILAHGGQIRAENDAGGGAVFRLSLPLAAA